MEQTFDVALFICFCLLQWTGITNAVWWQDFPRRSAPDFSSLFTQISDVEVTQGVQSDFAAQLAGFMASLMIDAPSQAHWIVELTKYDFNKAMGYLIASVPGIHSYMPQETLDLTDLLSVSVLFYCVVLSLGMDTSSNFAVGVINIAQLEKRNHI